MTKKFEVYKCAICGNVVEVFHEGVGTLVCCGQPMNLQKENSIKDEKTQEKHVPVITKNSEGVQINVGSIPHPMEKSHYIEWIEVSTEKGESKKFLQPEKDKPEVKFPVKNPKVKTRAYCNLHGLWKGK